MLLLLNPKTLFGNPRGGRRRRKRNPTPMAWAIGGVIAAATLGIGAAAVAARRRNTTRPVDPTPDPVPEQIECSPYGVIDTAAIEQLAVSIIDGGERDVMSVASQVANQLFGPYPKGFNVHVTFPPWLDIEGTQCVWEITVEIVQRLFDDRGLPYEPVEPIDEEDLSWVLHGALDDGYPWEQPSMQTQNYPTPGTFFDAGWNGAFDPTPSLDNFVIAVLASALQMAQQDPTLAKATGQDPRAELAKTLRRGVRHALIQTGSYNDVMFGQTNLNLAGGNDPNMPGGDPNKARGPSYILNSAGRSLNWTARHADLKTRIANGSSLLRTTRLNGSVIPGLGGTHHMLIWVPAFDLNALAQQIPEIRLMLWPDGSSTVNPSPRIMQLGFDMSGVVLPEAA